jgi:hypothetical protein
MATSCRFYRMIALTLPVCSRGRGGLFRYAIVKANVMPWIVSAYQKRVQPLCDLPEFGVYGVQ